MTAAPHFYKKQLVFGEAHYRMFLNISDDEAAAAGLHQKEWRQMKRDLNRAMLGRGSVGGGDEDEDNPGLMLGFDTVAGRLTLEFSGETDEGRRLLAIFLVRSDLVRFNFSRSRVVGFRLLNRDYISQELLT